MRKWQGCDHLHYWIGWNLEHGFLIPVSSDGENIDGLVAARPVKDAAQAKEEWAYDEQGQYVVIDLCLARAKNMLKGIGVALAQRFGHRKYVCWQRNGKGKMRIYNAGNALHKVLNRGK